VFSKLKVSHFALYSPPERIPSSAAHPSKGGGAPEAATRFSSIRKDRELSIMNSTACSSITKKDTEKHWPSATV
jgi:hypothetical protein